jgi:predicted nucleotidyltransferase
MGNTALIADARLEEITGDLTEYLVATFASKLKQIILFGSYARGDYDEWSDLDFMVLVDGEDNLIKKHDDSIASFISDAAIKYGVIPSLKDPGNKKCFFPCTIKDKVLHQYLTV